MSEQPPVQRTRSGATIALVLLFTINLFNYIDRYVLSAVLTPLKAEFDLSDDQVGFLQTGFLYAYMVAAPMLGRLAVRGSRWWIIGASVAVWSFASGWTGAAGSFGILLTSRILVGIGEAGYGPSAPALISDYYPVERRGKVMTIFYLAIPVGSALGYVIGGKMNSLYDWRHAFYVVVIPGILLSIWCFLMREPVPNRKEAPGAKHSFLKDLRALVGIRSYLYNTGAMTAMTFAIGGIAFWMPHYIQQRIAFQQGLKDTMHLAALPQSPLSMLEKADLKTKLDGILEHANTTFGIIVVVGGLVSTFLGGWVADRLRTRWKGAYFITSGTAILFAFPCILAMLKLQYPYAWFPVAGAVFFLFFNTGPANTALANVTSSALRATAFALNIFVIHALGDALSPPLIGWMHERTDSWDVPFTIVSLMTLLASALWWIGAKYLPQDEAAADKSQGT